MGLFYEQADIRAFAVCKCINGLSQNKAILVKRNQSFSQSLVNSRGLMREQGSDQKLRDLGQEQADCGNQIQSRPARDH